MAAQNRHRIESDSVAFALLRLRRLMCGKALPFRRNLEALKGYACGEA